MLKFEAPFYDPTILVSIMRRAGLGDLSTISLDNLGDSLVGDALNEALRETVEELIQ